MTEGRIEDVGRVREALEAVLASAPFSRSPRMSRFLRHVVDAVLSGEEGDLKETSIGVAVFDRSPDYDPKVDPVVRNEARRLRATLDRYYAGDGIGAVLRISIPKGGYRPRFDVRATTTERLVQARARRWRPRRRLVAFGAALLLLSAVVTTALVARLSRFPRTEASAPRIHTLTTYREREIHPSIAPDNRHIAFSWDRHGNYDIYVKTVDDDEPVRMTTDPANDLHPAWSPDGREIAFARASGDGFDILIMSAQGGSERRITRVEGIDAGRPLEEVLLMLGNPGPAWSRDGASLAVTAGGMDAGGRPLSLVPIDRRAPETSGRSQQPRILTHPPAGAHDFFPAFSPDGTQLAFGRQQTNSTSELYVVPVTGGPERRVDFGRGDLRGVAWMPDGRAVVVSSNLAGAYRLWKVRLDGGAPELLPTAGRSAREPSVSPDGRWIAYSDASLQSELWRTRTTLAGESPGAPELLIGSTRQNHSAQFSPDGRSVAFVSDRSGSWEIWVSGADGANATQVTRFEGPLLGTVHWSPDSRFLAFDARPAGHSAIHVVPSGGGPARRLAENRFEEKMPAWSHDGRWLYFNSNRGGSQQLWRTLRAGGEAERLSTQFAMDSAEAPDGASVYFLDREPGIWQVAPGREATRVAGLERVVTRRLWAVNATGIWFLDHAIDRQAIWLYRFATRRTERVANLGNDVVLDVPGLSVSPDDRWLLYSRQTDSQSDLWMVGEAGAR